MSDFNLAEGYEIQDFSSLEECFQVTDDNIVANISSNNLYKIILDMISLLPEPVFFFIEAPCDDDEEKSLSSNNSTTHKKVYYLDNCNHKVARAIMKRYGELLINDGLVQFGFGSHSSEEEIYIKKYNLFSVYSNNISEYAKVFKNNNIKKTTKIKTAWDILSNDNSGTCTMVEYNGESIYDIIENLADVGMYFSHNAED